MMDAYNKLSGAITPPPPLEDSDEDHYMFAPPFTSVVRPLITQPDVTISLLHEINLSFPYSKRLPREILDYINEQIHSKNIETEAIQSIWSPATSDSDLNYALTFNSFTTNAMKLDLKKMLYQTDCGYLDSPSNRTLIGQLYEQVSSADLLYRLRCFFPEVEVWSGGVNGYETVWGGVLHHIPSGRRLLISESKGGVHIGESDEHAYHGRADNDEDKLARDALIQCFVADVVRLMNAFLESNIENRPSAYYHPAAIVDWQYSSHERFIAVPDVLLTARIERDIINEANYVYRKWDLAEQPDINTSSFHSLIPDLKYDITSRKIDRLNGTTELTNVISSALLFYRLLCKYSDGISSRSSFRDIHQANPVTSVWQVQLDHRKTKAHVIFMDDCGFFDIRVDENADEVMADIEALVEGLCSDFCTHPYDGVLAGCIA